MGNKFNEIEVKNIIDNYVNKYMTTKEISLLYKCCRKAISKVLKENNIEIFSKFIILNEEEINEIINLYYIHRTVSAVSKIFKYKGKNLSDNFINKTLNENNIIKISRNLPTITNTQIEEIIELYKDETKNLYTKDLAEKYNVTYNFINNILDKNNITRKKNKAPTTFKAEQNKDYIICEYLKIKRITPIATELNISYDIINKLLKDNNILIDKKRIFNDNESIKICYEYENNIKTLQILADEYNVTKPVISELLKSNGYEIKKITPSHNKIELTYEETNKLIEQYQNPTITINTILKNFKLNKIVFYRILKENNIPIINKRYYNFTDDEINHIISSYGNGENTVTIGKLYNVLPEVINRLLVKNNIIIKDDRYLNFTSNNIKDIISLYNDNNSTKHIAELYNVSPDSIIKILRKNDILIKDPRIIDFTSDNVKDIINLYNQNNSAKKISKLYNTSVQPIYKILRDNNIEIINNNYINFTDDEIKDICNLYCDKQLSIKMICKKYDCSIPTIYVILKENNIKILNNSSSPEKLIKYILQYFDNTISEKPDKQILNGKEIDIITYDKKIGFEYNGLYYHSTNRKGDKYHINKTNLANENYFELYHIFEDEFLNDSMLVINLLLQKLNINHYITDECFEYLEDCFINEVNIQDIEIIKRNTIDIDFDDCYMTKIKSDIKQNQFYIGYGIVKYFDETNNINYGIFTKENNIQIGYISINSDNIIENFHIEDKYNLKNLNITIFNNYIKEYKPNNLTIKFDKRWFSKKHLKDFENLGFIIHSEEEPRISYYKGDKRFHEYDISYSENIIHDCGVFVYKIEL